MRTAGETRRARMPAVRGWLTATLLGNAHSIPTILREYESDQCFRVISTPMDTRLATMTELQSQEAADILWDLERAPSRNHRKPWEFVYIVRALRAAGVLRPGARGLVFAAGREPTVSYFASLGVDITATDMDADRAVAAGWGTTNQHAADLRHLYRRHHIDLPPYKTSNHMRLHFNDHATTSVGWTARKPGGRREQRGHGA